MTAGLGDAMTANGITAEAYFAQNDGTLMSLDYVRRYPMLTIGSGPANSIRGAATSPAPRTRSSSTSAAPRPTSAS